MFVWSLGAQRRARLNYLTLHLIENCTFQKSVFIELSIELPIELPMILYDFL